MAKPFAGRKPGWHANATSPSTRPPSTVYPLVCGFDFLYTPNLALIIGPYSPDLADPLRKAAGIIQGNMEAGRIPSDGFLLLASVLYDEIGVDRARAEMKARFLSRFAAGVVSEEFPDLAGRMTSRTAILDWRSRSLELIGA